MTKPTDTQTQPPVGSRPSLLGIFMKYILPLVITVGLCYQMFTGIDLSEMMGIIRSQCNYWWIVLALVLSILSNVIRAARWQIQLRALGVKAPLWNLTLSMFGTYAVNLVFPRLGEFWRTGYVAKRQQAAYATVFGSMVADRLADTAAVGIITLSTFMLASGALVKYFSQNAALIGKLIALATSAWVWVAAAVGIALLWWLLRCKTTNRFILKIQHIARELWHGFFVILHMPGRVRWLLLVFGTWLCYFVQFYVTMYAFPFTEALLHSYGLEAALVAFVLSSISMGVPSNGGIGPWQWAVIFGLGIYGLDRGPATAFANTVMGSQTLMLILLGIFTFACVFFEKYHKPTDNKCQKY